MRGPTRSRSLYLQPNTYFNPQASCEARQSSRRRPHNSRQFQSTGLMRGPTTLLHGVVIKHIIFQSTGLMRGPTERVLIFALIRQNFNPQASCEARPYHAWLFAFWEIFQSTGLMRGPTDGCCLMWTFPIISIHRPHARPDVLLSSIVMLAFIFQSTGLMRGPTTSAYFSASSYVLFQSTGLMRGPTFKEKWVRTRGQAVISIHRPHARPDRKKNTTAIKL